MASLLSWDDLDRDGRLSVLAAYVAGKQAVLPPAAIHRNFLADTGVELTYPTCRRYLQELAANGRLHRVDRQALDDGDLRPAGEDARAWYTAAEPDAE